MKKITLKKQLFSTDFRVFNTDLQLPVLTIKTLSLNDLDTLVHERTFMNTLRPKSDRTINSEVVLFLRQQTTTMSLFIRDFSSVSSLVLILLMFFCV